MTKSAGLTRDVGLQVENVDLIEPDTIRFDFLGKDSIRYENEVKVERKIFELVKEFSAKDGNGRSESPLATCIMSGPSIAHLASAVHTPVKKPSLSASAMKNLFCACCERNVPAGKTSARQLSVRMLKMFHPEAES